MLAAQGEVEAMLCGVEREKMELLQDNHRMAQMLASSDGVKKDVAQVLERATSQRKDSLRQCKQFKDKGGCVAMGRRGCVAMGRRGCGHRRGPGKGGSPIIVFFYSEVILQGRISQLEAQVAASPSPRMEPHTPQATAEVRRLRKERDDLKEAISNFETELLQIQMDTKTLAEDRDNFKLLYEQVSLTSLTSSRFTSKTLNNHVDLISLCG